MIIDLLVHLENFWELCGHRGRFLVLSLYFVFHASFLIKSKMVQNGKCIGLYFLKKYFIVFKVCKKFHLTFLYLFVSPLAIFNLKFKKRVRLEHRSKSCIRFLCFECILCFCFWYVCVFGMFVNDFYLSFL